MPPNKRHRRVCLPPPNWASASGYSGRYASGLRSSWPRSPASTSARSSGWNKATRRGLDTRRALARAFEFEDVDVLNKPFTIPTEGELKAQKEKFDREHATLNALPLTTGKQLAKLAEAHMMDMSEPGFELSREADESFAELVDYFRGYRDCADAYSESAKFDVYDELQSRIDALKALGVSLCYAERRIQVQWGTVAEAKPMRASVLYVVAFPLGKEPEQFATPKSAGIRL